MSLEKRKKEGAGPAHPGEEGAQALDNWRKYGAVSSIATLLFVKLYGDIGATLSTVVVTVVVLIFGEITPKSVAKDFPERFAMFSAPLINLLIHVLTPINFIFSQWKKLISKLLNTKEDSKMSQEELMMLLEEAQRDGSIDKDEGALHCHCHRRVRRHPGHCHHGGHPGRAGGRDLGRARRAGGVFPAAGPPYIPD